MQRLFDAAADEDLLSMMEVLVPAERDVLRDRVVELGAQLRRLGLFDDRLDLEHVPGVDVRVERLKLRTETVSDDVVSVVVTGGIARLAVEGGRLPLGPLARQLFGEPPELLPSPAPAARPGRRKASGLRVSVPVLELSTDRQGREARVRIDRLSVQVEGPDGAQSFDYDGRCLQHSKAGGSAEEAICRDSDASRAGMRSSLPSFALTAVQRDGAWYVSPARSYLDSVLDWLRALDRERAAQVLGGGPAFMYPLLFPLFPFSASGPPEARECETLQPPPPDSATGGWYGYAPAATTPGPPACPIPSVSPLPAPVAAPPPSTSIVPPASSEPAAQDDRAAQVPPGMPPTPAPSGPSPSLTAVPGAGRDGDVSNSPPEGVVEQGGEPAPAGSGATETVRDDRRLGRPMRLHQAFASQLSRPHGALAPLAARMLNRANRPLVQLTVDALGVQPPDRVLDVGFGGGSSLDLLLAAAGEGLVAAVDPSPEMVRRAQRVHCRALHVRRLVVQVAGVEALPFPDGYFDRILSVQTIYFWSDVAVGLAELSRVLRRGGRLAIGTMAKGLQERVGFAQRGYRVIGEDEVADALGRFDFGAVTTRWHPSGHGVVVMGAKGAESVSGTSARESAPAG